MRVGRGCTPWDSQQDDVATETGCNRSQTFFCLLFFFFARFLLLCRTESIYRSTQLMSVKSISWGIVCLIEFLHSLCKQRNSVSSCCTHNYTWSRFIISFGGAARSINAFNLKLGHVHRFKKKKWRRREKNVCFHSLTHQQHERTQSVLLPNYIENRIDLFSFACKAFYSCWH